MFSLYLNKKQQQIAHIVQITFWSQFSSYALNSIMILFLTRPFLQHGLQYDQATAYAFIGVSSANRYLMTIIGGHIADEVLGLRRSILLGSVLLAITYLLVMLSGYTLPLHGDYYFLAAFACVPAAESLLIGTTSGMVAHIYRDDIIQAKSAMTYYYLAINVGALLASLIAPELLDSRYGPLSILTLSFAGKAIAALNFARHFRLYDNVASQQDHLPLNFTRLLQLITYFVSVYLFTLYAYHHLAIASIIISSGCILGISWFFVKTQHLPPEARYKQLLAAWLILEAIVFFVIYNQMNSTLVVLAQSNSDSLLFGLHISPAQYQMLNPLIIIALGIPLPWFYRLFPGFSIAYQFAAGTLLASLALLILAVSTDYAPQGLVNGNMIALTYSLISLAELMISAVGLSMIGLYCAHRHLAFAMGTWYLGCSLSNTIAALIAHWVAIPADMHSPVARLVIFHNYYLALGSIAAILGVGMLLFAYLDKNIYVSKLDC